MSFYIPYYFPLPEPTDSALIILFPFFPFSFLLYSSKPLSWLTITTSWFPFCNNFPASVLIWLSTAWFPGLTNFEEILGLFLNFSSNFLLVPSWEKNAFTDTSFLVCSIPFIALSIWLSPSIKIVFSFVGFLLVLLTHCFFSELFFQIPLALTFAVQQKLFFRSN